MIPYCTNEPPRSDTNETRVAPCRTLRASFYNPHWGHLNDNCQGWQLSLQLFFDVLLALRRFQSSSVSARNACSFDDTLSDSPASVTLENFATNLAIPAASRMGFREWVNLMVVRSTTTSSFGIPIITNAFSTSSKS